MPEPGVIRKVGGMALRRNVYMVLSPRSLSYASLAIESLLRQSADALHLHLITDSATDREELVQTVDALQPESRHGWNVTAEEELADAEARVFAGLTHLRAFRRGHPCWRKITDPLLIGEPGQELILLDPDLYFPNRFRFEETPAKGLLLMWQRPNCLLPPEVVRRAMDERIALARHVDIGVAHWRGDAELDWIDWLIGRLGGASLPRMMHVEAIVWAAIAMRQGGGYLDPKRWVCWHRTQATRVRLKLGVSGQRILAAEPWAVMKCFHAGGEAKWWLTKLLEAGVLPSRSEQLGPGEVTPFVELTSTRYEQEQRAKDALRRLGYYRLFSANAS